MDFTLDIGQLRGLGTLLVAIAFIGLALWVFSGRRDREFAEASLLPFADDRLVPAAKESESRSNGQ
ncbi:MULTISPECIES: CcoQ/FixQ family Cbb3-type cytochrome c oxidase assembly chaperone [Pseudomonas]|jgi:cytochrome c oxidase cbb3-type subunit 4|uniref:Cytochrome c oxidase cbb3-type subunit 4 n=2 Tax=Pseudomonas TaxID=286 RepID=A0A9X8EG70_PSEPU|nr:MULTISPECIES: CcoQ/FixQ family Cbb3-type cytochrome c oxidase assembly chaperone [Pseudomonas]KIU49967.1 cytochrome C oxidase [Pseudomonas putida]KTC17243.1 cytochrome C oxidase [Pseudomonas putida]MBG8561449.1 CcoQ/FixQ family Cbb3-type cytochrome c oxidase assembly chaperone [Pseudomonas qingdaonensis]MCO7506939.1 CcoQ/FixQ family Cbb3-type cytochrome c oxidase assembly chaperone [Pseudomonas sp. VE 267-6A]MCO7529984.1 CcoQ/FixQ family Cbb3-type cytochrome c oxidase assembly chaperone [Ps